MKRFPEILAVLLVLSVLAGRAPEARETGAVEFGIDAGLNVNLVDDTDNFTVVDVPSRMRVGFLVTPESAVETSFDLSLLTSEGTTVFDLLGGIDYLYNFRVGEEEGYFVRAGGRLAAKGLPGRTLTQVGLGGGIGSRIAVSPHWATRIDAGVERFFETEDLRGHTNITAAIGLSFFTR